MSVFHEVHIVKIVISQNSQNEFRTWKVVTIYNK